MMIPSAPYLIAIQVASRGLTFLANQILLCYLSPANLGVATQLDLYSTSSLYFARESIRIAVQRQPDGQSSRSNDTANKNESKGMQSVKFSGPQTTSQEIVNISYLSVALGGALLCILGFSYFHLANRDAFGTPFFTASLIVTGLACFLELLAEPCFAVVQLKMLYRTRAAIETTAALTRAVFTCGTAFCASCLERDVGILPFAMGHLSYALALLSGYFAATRPISRRDGFSLFLFPVNSRLVFQTAHHSESGR